MIVKVCGKGASLSLLPSLAIGGSTQVPILRYFLLRFPLYLFRGLAFYRFPYYSPYGFRFYQVFMREVYNVRGSTVLVGW